MFTPGPWIASDSGASYYMIGAPVSEKLKASDSRHIANVYENDDANLVAAAPDLLESLELVLNEMKEEAEIQCCGLLVSSKTLAKANAAIAKARGET